MLLRGHQSRCRAHPAGHRPACDPAHLDAGAQTHRPCRGPIETRPARWLTPSAVATFLATTQHPALNITCTPLAPVLPRSCVAAHLASLLPFGRCSISVSLLLDITTSIHQASALCPCPHRCRLRITARPRLPSRRPPHPCASRDFPQTFRLSRACLSIRRL